MRRLFVAALFALSLSSLSSSGAAQEHAPESPVGHGAGGASPEGGGGFPGADVNEEEARGIQNWWSWDYGPGAKEPSHRHLPPPFGFALVNFLIFAGIMYKLAAKPLKSYVKDRHDRIRIDLDEAAKLRAQAETELRAYQAKVKNVDQEIEALLAQIKVEAEADKLRIIAAAEQQAQRLKAEAERQIAAEIARARQELRQGVIEAALAGADTLLKQQIGADDQRKMAEKYVTSLEQSAKAGRPV